MLHKDNLFSQVSPEELLICATSRHLCDLLITVLSLPLTILPWDPACQYNTVKLMYEATLPRAFFRSSSCCNAVIISEAVF